MSLLLQREHSLFCLMIVDGNKTPLGGLPVGLPVGQGHEGAFQLKLRRELPFANVEKQNSILLPYGGVVLMAN
jgi:hypothetical protein